MFDADFAARLRRLIVEKGYRRPSGAIDYPKLTEVLRLRANLTASLWSDRRAYRLATGRTRPTADDVRALADGLEVEDWRLLRDERPRRRKGGASIFGAGGE